MTDDARTHEEGLRAKLMRGTRGSLSGRVRRPAPPSASSEGSETSSMPARSSRLDYQAVRAGLHARLLDELSLRNLLDADDEQLSRATDEFVGRVLEEEELPLNAAERSRLAEDLREETLGIGVLAPLMADPVVTDILVNGPDEVYVERFGRMEPTEVRFRDAQHIVRVIERIAARVGRRIDVASPMVDLRLQDGSRVNATIPPVSPDGPTISIRRFGRGRLRRRQLVELGMLSEPMVALLDYAVRMRKNLLIAGGTGAGKSTLLGALCEAIPSTERIVTIEDTAELMLDQDNWIRLETRPANVEGEGEINAMRLMINTLRMRPDRVIVGEVRGGEALVMLQAMNTGHEGGMSTLHANAPRDALSRLETMVLMAGYDLPVRAIREQICSAIDLLVHVRRFEDGVRRVESIVEVIGMESDVPLLQELFRFDRQGLHGRRIDGRHIATGILPRFVQELRRLGVDVPDAVLSGNRT